MASKTPASSSTSKVQTPASSSTSKVQTPASSSTSPSALLLSSSSGPIPTFASTAMNGVSESKSDCKLLSYDEIINKLVLNRAELQLKSILTSLNDGILDEEGFKLEHSQIWENCKIYINKIYKTDPINFLEEKHLADPYWYKTYTVMYSIYSAMNSGDIITRNLSKDQIIKVIKDRVANDTRPLKRRKI
jgi:hypothetical protein